MARHHVTATVNGDRVEFLCETSQTLLEALRDFLAVATGAGATRMIAVATSAVRDATDGPVLVERARLLGVPLQVIDGDHEARLGFAGAVHDLPVTSGLTMDVGGGSVELVRFRDRRMERARIFALPGKALTRRRLFDAIEKMGNLLNILEL